MKKIQKSLENNATYLSYKSEKKKKKKRDYIT